MAFRSHCNPNASNRAPTTRRSVPIGIEPSAGPSAATRTASTIVAAPTPIRVERQPRTTPTPSTIVNASTISTALAKKAPVTIRAVVVFTTTGSPRSPLPASELSLIACAIGAGRDAPRRDSGSASGEADQLEPFVAALGHLLLDLADSSHVVLLLELRFDRAPLDCGERLREGPIRHFHGDAEPEHSPLAARPAGRVILLPVHLVRLRVAAHDDPRLGSVDPSLPRVTCADESAVLEF